MRSFDEYPGQRLVRAHVGQRCAGVAFTDHVGVDYADSELGLCSLWPSPEPWRLGDRGLVCIATTVDGEPLVGGVRDANR